MNYTENKDWQKLFGTAWDTLTQATEDIGAFAAFADTGLVLFDRNAKHMLGLNSTPVYSEFINIIGKINTLSSSDTGLVIKTLDTVPNILAGIIFTSTEEKDAEENELLSLYSQTYLIKKINAAKSPSMLALIQLEGIDDSAMHSCFTLSAVNAVVSALPDNAIISAHSKSQYWIYIPDFCDDSVSVITKLQNAVKSTPLTDESGHVISETHSMTISAGISKEGGSAYHRMFTANFALFDATSKGAGSICKYSDQRYESQKTEYNNIKVFTKLVDLNLFKYHFQPIISAKTGDVVAYEALMRTDASIGLNPLQILDFAQKYSRLYDIEKATLRNTLDFLSENQETFEKRKLFINVISSEILSDSDYRMLCSDFGELMEKVVIELTEQTEITDEKLSKIHTRIANQKMELAIDDYGTGYSNTSNLIRYNPVYVKIDRSLISDINSDIKKQRIVSNTIEALHASGYIALGEGVETTEELQTLIHMGIDLIQGYYVSRPKPVLLHEISEALKSEIVRYNLEASGEIQKIYRCDNDETVDVSQLALDHYTDIFVGNAKLRIESSGNHSSRIAVTVKEGCSAEVTLKDVHLESYEGDPLVILNKNSKLTLICEGSSILEKGGIFVPETTSLRLTGSGNLSINTALQKCYAIGNLPDKAYGNILIDLSGHLNVSSDGESCVVIGGGKNPANSVIQLDGGEINVSTSGGTCLGIGSITGNSIIEANNCSLAFKLSSGRAVAMGAVVNTAKIDISHVRVSVKAQGNMLCGMGVLQQGQADITTHHGSMKTTMNGRKIISIGTCGGICNYTSDHFSINFYSEGASMSGIGDMEGGGDIRIASSDLMITFLTSDGLAIGNKTGTCELNNVVKVIKVNE